MFDALYLVAYGPWLCTPALGNLVSNNFGNRSAVTAMWSNIAINARYASAADREDKKNFSIFGS